MVVQAAVERGPLQLIFQDLHLMDPPSQQLVAALVTRATFAHPFEVLVTHDPQLARRCARLRRLAKGCRFGDRADGHCFFVEPLTLFCARHAPRLDIRLHPVRDTARRETR